MNTNQLMKDQYEAMGDINQCNGVHYIYNLLHRLIDFAPSRSNEPRIDDQADRRR